MTPDSGIGIRTERFVPESIPEGCERVPLEDVAHGRWTRQSSTANTKGSGAWMRPTRPEVAPWWEIDLGRRRYIEAVRIHIDSPPRTARVRVVFHSSPDERGAPPRWIAWETEARAGSTRTK